VPQNRTGALVTGAAVRETGDLSIMRINFRHRP